MAKIQWSGRNHHFPDVTLSHPHGDTVFKRGLRLWPRYSQIDPSPWKSKFALVFLNRGNYILVVTTQAVPVCRVAYRIQ